MEVGDQVVTVLCPVSRTLFRHRHKLAVIIRFVSDTIAVIQLQDRPGKIGQRQVLIEDLVPSGQLRMF